MKRDVGSGNLRDGIVEKLEANFSFANKMSHFKANTKDKQKIKSERKKFEMKIRNWKTDNHRLRREKVQSTQNKKIKEIQN